MAQSGNEMYEKALAAAGIVEDAADASMDSLSGAIKGASQEEINALAGAVNNTMVMQREELDMTRESLSLLREQLMHLANIDAGIGVSNEILERIDGKLEVKSDPLRAVGISG
jgi:hypothetical protein